MLVTRFYSAPFDFKGFSFLAGWFGSRFGSHLSKKMHSIIILDHYLLLKLGNISMGCASLWLV